MSKPVRISDERGVVDRILQGDKKSFSLIIKATENLVAQILFKMVRNEDDRKDLAQDVYLKAYNNLSGFKFESKLSTWIAQIAYNLSINYLNKRKPESIPDKFNDYNNDEEIISDLSVENKSTYDQVEKKIYGEELKQILEKEIDKLSPVYKTLITLFHNEEMSYEEISIVTQLPEGTVKNYLFRARRILKNNLLKKYNSGDL
ncbi:MAG: sigma-70 family RNA polymerase sigma factor [Bacteroidota bacterium]